jgi:hypothetical protein
METYDIEIWHKVKKNANGVVIKEQYVLSKFVDSDSAWLGGFKKEKLHIRFNTEHAESGHAHDDETCMCPPALSSWKCSTKEYEEIMDGTRCEYYRSFLKMLPHTITHSYLEPQVAPTRSNGNGRRSGTIWKCCDWVRRPSFERCDYNAVVAASPSPPTSKR